MYDFLSSPVWQGLGVIISLVTSLLSLYRANAGKRGLYGLGVISIFTLGFFSRGLIPSQRPFNSFLTEGYSKIVTVPAKNNWMSSGVTLQQGDFVEIIVTGGWAHQKGIARYSAAGILERFDIKAVGKKCPVGSLIGNINDGQIFYIGTNVLFKSHYAGSLNLTMNDFGFDDNEGDQKVTINIKSDLDENEKKRLIDPPKACTD